MTPHETPLVTFRFSSHNVQFRKRLFDAIMNGECPDFEHSLGSPSRTGHSYTASWRPEHAGAVRAWATALGEDIARPRIGQRVRFTRADHPHVPLGHGGMIDQLGNDDQFFVLTDGGGFFGWTTFDGWEPTDEPDMVLNPEYVHMRTRALCDDSAIRAVLPEVKIP